MIVFWMMSGLVAALTALIVLAGARRGADPAVGIETDAGRHELDALDALKSRGLMDEASHAAARTEAARRLLAGQATIAKTDTPPKAGRHDRHYVLGGLVATVAMALGLYVWLGSPGMPDQAYERRVDEWAESLDSLEPEQIAAVAARVVAERPNDAQALEMLGVARFQAGDPLAAASAFRRLLALNPDDADSWARLGESLVRAANGRVGGDAEVAFIEAVKRDPGQLGARYFLGELFLERGDAAATAEMWGPLIAALDPADPRRQDLEQRMPVSGAK